MRCAYPPYEGSWLLALLISQKPVQGLLLCWQTVEKPFFSALFEQHFYMDLRKTLIFSVPSLRSPP
jgi:hypothetical protein